MEQFRGSEWESQPLSEKDREILLEAFDATAEQVFGEAYLNVPATHYRKTMWVDSLPGISDNEETIELELQADANVDEAGRFSISTYWLDIATMHPYPNFPQFQLMEIRRFRIGREDRSISYKLLHYLYSDDEDGIAWHALAEPEEYAAFPKGERPKAHQRFYKEQRQRDYQELIDGQQLMQIYDSLKAFGWVNKPEAL